MLNYPDDDDQQCLIIARPKYNNSGDDNSDHSSKQPHNFSSQYNGRDEGNSASLHPRGSQYRGVSRNGKKWQVS